MITLTPLKGTVAPAISVLRVLAFTWPLLVYTVRNLSTQALAGHAYDH